MASREPALERSPRWAPWLALVAGLALAVLALAHLGAGLNRRLGEPALSELHGVQPIVETTASDGPPFADAASAGATKYLALPNGWPDDRAAAPQLLVFVDGAPVPFRRRPTNVPGALAYYYPTDANRLGLAVRCASEAACRHVSAFARTPSLEAGLSVARIGRSPATLLALALSILASGFWIVAARRRWRPAHLGPVVLGVTAASAPFVLGSTDTILAPLALAVSLAFLGAPMLGAAFRRCRDRWSAWPDGTRLAVGSATFLVLVFAPLTAPVFPSYLAAPPSASDHAAYLRLAQDPTLLPHAFYPILVALAAGFSNDLESLSRASLVVLTALVLLKLGISLAFVQELLNRVGSRLSLAAAAGLAFGCFVVAPLPNWWQFPRILLGQLSPTIWHSPTAIASLPFAVGAFWLLARAPRAPLAVQVAGSAMLLLSLLAKPNFALAFLPAAFLLALAGRFDRRAFLLCAAVTLPVLGWQYQHWSEFGVTRAATSGILTFLPLEVWRLFSPHPFASLVLSLAFPLAVALLVRGDSRLPDAFAAAWLLTAIAVAQFALLAEGGNRWRHGNYYWGTVPALYILFLVSLCELAGFRADSGGRRAAQRACWILLGIHVASGVLLYVRSLLGHGYRA